MTGAVSIDRVTPFIGAEVSGVDMSQPLGNETFAILHDALVEHGVLFFRDQDITPAQHKDFASRFGHLQVHPFAPNLGEDHPEIIVIEHGEKRAPDLNNWHTDVTFMAQPPLGSVLHAKVMPDTGGDTMWASMYAAYEALSDRMQRLLGELVAIHDYEHVFGKAGRLYRNQGTDKMETERRKHPLAEHPVIRTHPVTGRHGIFVNSSFTVRIKDMKQKESDALLTFLHEHIKLPEFQCRFRWRENSVAFWDNRCTQHYAIADYFPHHRKMHRVTIDGDTPVFRPH
ncbi:taurine dioxygenase [Pyruvatibacter mobilis]|uniref:taurine dioxygenase n=1 Tax=Pyruvatibacter mobilis TaxID=1712261 RepID=UPI003BABA3F4